MSDCFDHECEAWDRRLDGEEEMYNPPLTQAKTCNGCGQKGLFWRQHPNGRWHLYDTAIDDYHYCNRIELIIDMETNVESLKPLTKEEEKQMLNRKFALVKFDQDVRDITTGTGKEVAYFTDIDLEEGDKVVVDTASHGYSVVTVVKTRGLTPGQRNKATKWIVAKVDVDAYKERMRKQEAAQEIRNKLQERKSQSEEMLIYKMLAKDDPEIKKLLEELADVDDTVQLELKDG